MAFTDHLKAAIQNVTDIYAANGVTPTEQEMYDAAALFLLNAAIINPHDDVEAFIEGARVAFTVADELCQDDLRSHGQDILAAIFSSEAVSDDEPS